MTEKNYIALAIPFFFLFIGLEWAMSLVLKRRVYRFNDAVTDLGCGISQQIVGVFINGAFLLMYVKLYEHASLVRLAPTSVWPWVIGFFGVDLAYYWWHRASHRMNLIWATHVVHHQSQDYNLAVALRQAWFSTVTNIFFYLPLAVAGVPTIVFVTLHSFSTLYQFWIHTELIGTLGPIEWIFNTPSHHRVHHAVNPRYIDKNYAATLIIWDRLFGTFEKETEPCVYGTVKPFKSWNPIWANFEFLWYLGGEAMQVRGLLHKFLFLFAPPERKASGGSHEIPLVDKARFEKFDTPVSHKMFLYVSTQFVIAVVLTTWILFKKNSLPPPLLAASSLIVLASVLSWSGFFENRRWAKPFEAVRLTALVVLGGLVFWPSTFS